MSVLRGYLGTHVPCGGVAVTMLEAATKANRVSLLFGASDEMLMYEDDVIADDKIIIDDIDEDMEERLFLGSPDQSDRDVVAIEDLLFGDETKKIFCSKISSLKNILTSDGQIQNLGLCNLKQFVNIFS